MRKYFVVLGSILCLFVLTLASCKKDNKDNGNDLIGSIWIDSDSDFTTFALIFTDEHTFMLDMDYLSPSSNTKIHHGTYTKKRNVVTMIFEESFFWSKWEGVINNETMTVPIENTYHSIIFIKQ